MNDGLLLNLKKTKNFREFSLLINQNILEKISLYLDITLLLVPVLMFFLNLIFSGDIKTIWLTCILLIGLFTNINAFIYYYKIYVENGKKYIFDLLRQNMFIIFFILFFIWLFLSCCFSSNKFISFFGSDYLSEGFICYVSYFGLFMNSLIIRKKQFFNKIISIFVFSVTFISIMTLFDYYFANLNFHFLRPFTSIFMNENHYAYYLNMGLVCNLCSLLFLKNNKKMKVIYIIFYIINCHTLILNNTLGCYLAFIAIICLVFVYLIIKKEKKMMFFLLCLIFAFISLFNETVVSNNFKDLSSDVNSIKNTITDKTEISEIYSVGTNRMGLWINGLNFIIERPLFGYGVDNLLEQYIRVGNCEITSRPHNEYIQVGASIGIPGLIFYLLFLATLFYKVLKELLNISPLKIIFTFVALAYLISAFFGVSVFYTTPYLYMFLGLLVCHKFDCKQ